MYLGGEHRAAGGLRRRSGLRAAGRASRPSVRLPRRRRGGVLGRFFRRVGSVRLRRLCGEPRPHRSIQMANLPNEAKCKRVSSLFNDLVDPGLRYAHRKRFLTQPLAAYSEAADLWEGFPEGWEQSVLGILAAGSVFTRPDRVAGFLRTTKEPLIDPLVDIARLWRKRP